MSRKIRGESKAITYSLSHSKIDFSLYTLVCFVHFALMYVFLLTGTKIQLCIYILFKMKMCRCVLYMYEELVPGAGIHSLDIAVPLCVFSKTFGNDECEKNTKHTLINTYVCFFLIHRHVFCLIASRHMEMERNF